MVDAAPSAGVGACAGAYSRRRCFAGRWAVRFSARPSGLRSGGAAWADVRFVIRAHRAQRAHLVVGEFVIGITMLGAEDASGTRVTSRRAIRLDFDAMSETFGDVPSSGKTHSANRTCADAATHSASGTWVEIERGARLVEIRVEQECNAKCDPRTVFGMDDDTEDAWAGEAAHPREFHEVERRTSRHKRIDGCALDACGSSRGYDIALDHLPSEIVEGIVAITPSGVLRGMGSEGAPESAATIADNDNRAGVGENRGRAHCGRRGRIVAVGGDRGDEVEAEGGGCVADGGEEVSFHCCLRDGQAPEQLLGFMRFCR